MGKKHIKGEGGYRGFEYDPTFGMNSIIHRAPCADCRLYHEDEKGRNYCEIFGDGSEFDKHFAADECIGREPTYL